MNKKQLYEAIMLNVSRELRKALNEKAEKKYSYTYVSGPMYFFNDDDEKIYVSKSLKDVRPITFNKNDLNKYIYIAKSITDATENINICDPFYENGKMCFDIESDIPFNTPITGYGKGWTLKDAVKCYLDG